MIARINDRWQYDYIALSGRVERLYIDWIKQFCIPNPSKTTYDSEGNVVDLIKLAHHIQKEGLIHPGTIEVSRKTKKARLIAGNHRIQAYEEMQLVSFPVYVVVVDDFDDNNGEGVDCSSNLLNIVDDTVGDVIAKPSDVFKDIRDKKEKGYL